MLKRGGHCTVRADVARPDRIHAVADRHLMPLRGAHLCAFLAVMALAGCAYKATVPPSQGHLSAENVPVRAPDEKIPAAVTTANFVPPPKPQAKVPTYSVVVSEVPVKELLFALSRDTRQNIDVHPSVQGLVTLNAIDETLPAILERISQQINVRVRTEGRSILVMPDTPYFRTYKVNYVNMNRDTSSSIGVSGEISGTVGTQTQASRQCLQLEVDTRSNNNFWELMRQNIEASCPNQGGEPVGRSARRKGGIERAAERNGSRRQKPCRGRGPMPRRCSTRLFPGRRALLPIPRTTS
jgi:hypothetical protein